MPPHGAKHACRGIIPLVLVCVHVRLHRRRTRQRHGSSCARAAGLKYSSAAAATVAKFTVPAPARQRSQQEAGRRYQATAPGRMKRAARNRLYRARMKIVTHQGSPPQPRNDVVPPDAAPLAATVTASKPAAAREVVMRSRPPEPGFLHCHWCGERCSPLRRKEFLRRRQRGSSHDRRQRKHHDHPS